MVAHVSCVHIHEVRKLQTHKYVYSLVIFYPLTSLSKIPVNLPLDIYVP